MKFAGLPVAKSLEFNARAKPSAKSLTELFPEGAIIKPADKGSSVGLVVARSEKDAAEGLAKIDEGEWMAEEFYKGREFSIGVIDGKAAGVVEISPEGGVYDFKRKYTGRLNALRIPRKDFKNSRNRNAKRRRKSLCRLRLPRLRARRLPHVGGKSAEVYHTRNKYAAGNDAHKPAAQKRKLHRLRF